MGIKLFLLKPNLTTISATATHETNGVGTIASATATTITLDKNVYAVCEYQTKASSVRSDWIYITRGSYTYCWKIILCTNENPSVITIDGNTTGLSLTAGDAYAIRSAVSADCNWTDPSTITYIELKANSFAEQDLNEIKITRFVNSGAVIINLKKFGDTGAITNWFVGNSNNQTTGAANSYQILRALSYIHSTWPSTSPAYSILFRYNPDGFPSTTIAPGSEDKSRYKYRAGAYRQLRALILKYSLNEDFTNNQKIDQLPLEIF